MKIVVRIVLILLSLTGGLLLAEGLTRAGGFWVQKNLDTRRHFQRSDIPGVPYVMKPHLNEEWSGVHVRSNSLGLADLTEPKDVNEKCFRVLVLGNSFTLGFGVDYGLSWPKRLEALLSHADACVQVINAAQDAFTAMDENAYLKALIPLYKPQLIIFDVNRLSMDDSMSVDTEGRLSPAGFVAGLETVRYSWNLNRRYIDLENPAAAINAPARARSVFGAWLNQHSYAYRVWEPKWIRLQEKIGGLNEETCPSARCLDIRPRTRNLEGKREQFLPFAPILLSPSRQALFYRTLNEATAQARAAKAQILFLMQDMPLDRARMPTGSDVHFVDLTEVAERPLNEFIGRYNLVWDYHPNAKGHEIIAQGMKRYFAAKGWISTNEKLAPLRYDNSYLARAYQEVQREQREAFGPAIDLITFRGFYQIAGGLNSGRVFNGAQQRLHALLRLENPRTFILRGTNQAVDSQKIDLRFGDGDRWYDVSMYLPVGPFEERLSLDLFKLRAPFGMNDLELRCHESICGPLILDGMALE